MTGTHGKKATEACPCGHLGDPSGKCRCTSEQIQRYRLRISGPLLDRIDMHVEVPRLRAEVLQQSATQGENSATVLARVMAARQRQWQRQGCDNAKLNAAELERHALPDAAGQALVARAIQKFALSARAYHRILKVARTIADLAAAEQTGVAHISEAIALRQLDRGTANG